MTVNRPPCQTVHPRSRGEHTLAIRLAEQVAGSSPLARGTHADYGAARRAWRFIPARAGNTGAEAGRQPHDSVHPRSRGEHFPSLRRTPRPTGSSPLARGTRLSDGYAGSGQRFIPARAGNTSGARAFSIRTTVHPRSRGEHAGRTMRRASNTGSSPLARGTPTGRSRARGRQRFIPARAGNTLTARRYRKPSSVHPRSRGEHVSSYRACANCGGSSPLARGTRYRYHAQ